MKHSGPVSQAHIRFSPRFFIQSGVLVQSQAWYVSAKPALDNLTKNMSSVVLFGNLCWTQNVFLTYWSIYWTQTTIHVISLGSECPLGQCHLGLWSRLNPGLFVSPGGGLFPPAVVQRSEGPADSPTARKLLQVPQALGQHRLSDQREWLRRGQEERQASSLSNFRPMPALFCLCKARRLEDGTRVTW